jgi:pre-mRNA-splicing factor SPF27
MESSDYVPRKRFSVPVMSVHLTFPELDAPLNERDRGALMAVVQAERPSDYLTTLHPRIDDQYTPQFSLLVTAELDRLEASEPKPKGTGIDTSRYTADAIEAPHRTLPESEPLRSEVLEQWRNKLRQAKISSTYLSGRNTNLALLESYGKNAWLVQNWNQEAVRSRLEAELAEVNSSSEALAEDRRVKQEAAAAEASLLEDSWKKGIRGLVEVQLATEDLRRQVLAARNQAAADGH